MFIQTEATPNPRDPQVPAGARCAGRRTARFPQPPRPPLIRRWPKAFRHFRRYRRVPRIRLYLGDQGRHQLGPYQAGHSRRDHGSFLVRQASSRRGRAGRQSRRGRVLGTFRKTSETVEVIKELLATRVRPAVAIDGGDITFKGFKEGTVFLHMQGACSGCPSSTATLKSGIENLLRHFVPGVEARARHRHSRSAAPASHCCAPGRSRHWSSRWCRGRPNASSLPSMSCWRATRRLMPISPALPSRPVRAASPAFASAFPRRVAWPRA